MKYHLSDASTECHENTSKLNFCSVFHSYSKNQFLCCALMVIAQPQIRSLLLAGIFIQLTTIFFSPFQVGCKWNTFATHQSVAVLWFVRHIKITKIYKLQIPLKIKYLIISIGVFIFQSNSNRLFFICFKSIFDSQNFSFTPIPHKSSPIPQKSFFLFLFLIFSGCN